MTSVCSLPFFMVKTPDVERKTVKIFSVMFCVSAYFPILLTVPLSVFLAAIRSTVTMSTV